MSLNFELMVQNGLNWSGFRRKIRNERASMTLVLLLFEFCSLYFWRTVKSLKHLDAHEGCNFELGIRNEWVRAVSGLRCRSTKLGCKKLWALWYSYKYKCSMNIDHTVFWVIGLHLGLENKVNQEFINICIVQFDDGRRLRYEIFILGELAWIIF